MLCRNLRLQPFVCLRALSSSNLRFDSYHRKGRQRRYAKPNGAVLSPVFLDKLQLWPQLLEEEIKADYEKVSEYLQQEGISWIEMEERALGLGDLSYANLEYDAMQGALLKLARPMRIDKIDKKRVFRWMKPGTPVSIFLSNELTKIAECVVRDINMRNIELRITDPTEARKFVNYDLEVQKFALIPSQERGTIQTLQQFLDSNFHKQNRAGVKLIEYAFRGSVMPSIHDGERRLIHSVPEDFTDSQKRAVTAALNPKRPFLCIQGPPGTGKTRVLAEIVRLLKEKKKRVLVCAPTHVAVDNAMRYTQMSIARQRKNNANDEDTAESSEQIGDGTCEADSLYEVIRRNSRFRYLNELSQDVKEVMTDENSNRKIRQERLKHWKLEKKDILTNIYNEHDVIFCTLTSSFVRKMREYNWQPDVIVIDEAAQCMEPATWAAIVNAPRCILVGDFKQLPPIIKSHKALENKLHVSLMERLVGEFPNSNLRILLDTQYRMNEAIMRWSSEYFYDGDLKAADCVKGQRLSDISLMPVDHPLNCPLIMFDTQLSLEQREAHREEQVRMSRMNMSEVEYVKQYIEILVNQCDISERDIVVITPYYEQMQALQKLLFVYARVRVQTIDAFQGQESEIVLFSMVRNNAQRIVGFLGEERRLNVALTRAKRQFVLFGASHMMNAGSRVRQHKDKQHLHSLYQHIRENGTIFSPHQISHMSTELKSAVQCKDSMKKLSNF